MAIPAEVLKTISLIDERVKEMLQAKAALVAAFGGNGNQLNSPEHLRKQVASVSPPPSEGLTRKGTLKAFLRHHGPSTRAQIMAGLPDFPDGTLAYLLNEKQGFVRSDSGQWYIAPGEDEK